MSNHLLVEGALIGLGHTPSPGSSHSSQWPQVMCREAQSNSHGEPLPRGAVSFSLPTQPLPRSVGTTSEIAQVWELSKALWLFTFIVAFFYWGILSLLLLQSFSACEVACLLDAHLLPPPPLQDIVLSHLHLVGRAPELLVPLIGHYSNPVSWLWQVSAVT